MTIAVYTYREVDGDPALVDRILTEEADDLLTADGSAEPAADGTFLIALHGHVLGADVERTVRVRLGTAGRDDGRLRIPISWHAEPLRHLFPTFEGTIEYQPLARDLGQLTIAGAYRPPLGLVGTAADTVTGLRRVAQPTAEWLTERLAEWLERLAAGEPTLVIDRDARELRVGDVMTPNPVLLEADAPLRAGAMLLYHYDVSGAPVVAKDGTLVGVLSERDLLEKEATVRDGPSWRLREARRRRRAWTIGEAATTPARTTRPDVTLHEAAREMLDHDVSRLVVIDGADIVGILTRHDILKAFDRSDEELRQAAATRLAEAGEIGKELVVTVRGGVVQLAGQVPRLSDVASLEERIAAVDGVTGVDTDDVVYEVDDTVPLSWP